MTTENQHIPASEIRQDIIDTEREIVQMEREVQGFTMVGDRLSMFRADARRSGIKERQEFIEKLKHILMQRGENL